MIFSFTPGVSVKKDAGKESKDKTGAKEMEDKTTEEGKEAKPWMSAL